MPYPGSTPEDVEQGIILVIEEAIRGLEGVKEITATASEGVGVVTAELLEGANQQRVYQDIKQEIDRIVTFPDDAEEPEVSMVVRRREVINLILYGDVTEWVLREMAERVRDSLLQSPGITQVELEGARDYEIKVEINQDTLRTYGLTLDTVAKKIAATAIELPGGTVETSGGDILLRMTERRDWARQYAQMPIIVTPAGSVIRLGEIAEVRDDFKDVDREAYFDDMRSIGIEVYRIGDQTPIGVADATLTAMGEIENTLPKGINWTVGRDMSDIYRQRLELLLKNAAMGLVLVLILLGLFLEIKLAFWVTMGFPSRSWAVFCFCPQ